MTAAPGESVPARSVMGVPRNAEADARLAEDMEAINRAERPWLYPDIHPHWCKCQRVCGGDQ